MARRRQTDMREANIPIIMTSYSRGQPSPPSSPEADHRVPLEDLESGVSENVVMLKSQRFKGSPIVDGPELLDVGPQLYRVEPYFPKLQMAPIRLLDRLLPGRKSRIGALAFFYGLWFLLFYLVLHQSVTSPVFPGFAPPVRLSCTSRLWTNSTDCGLDGDRCQPFDDSSFVFRCPANCRGSQVFEPYAVGTQEILYQNLVIGGFSPDKRRPIYRGDSFICAAALHAGIISDSEGGCGLLSRVGEQSNYPSVKANGVSSIAFPSYFPLSLTFGELEKGKDSGCHDLRWQLLAMSVVFTVCLSLFTTSPAIFFVSVFTGVFFHVVLVSDPPDFLDYSEVISIASRRFLPAAFIGCVLYYVCIHRTLRGLNAQMEKTFLWLGGCWVGALHNYTFDKIPLSRLTPHDLKQQPGAVTALVILIGLICAIAVGQAWAFWREGRLPAYLQLYAVMGGILLALVAVPHMNLRIHHYILALLLLPGTALQTRPSLLYQGILMGIFINGVARWGFASILQTPAQLLGDGQVNSALPLITVPTIDLARNTVTFNLTQLAESVAGISVLVNDVQRFTSFPTFDNLDSFTWTRHREDVPEFFRFGYVFRDSLGGIWHGDFTKAGTWKEDGSWVHMESGPSR